MFLGAMPRRPDKATAYKQQLKKDLTAMGIFVVIVRATPYVLHFLTKEKQELRLQF